MPLPSIIPGGGRSGQAPAADSGRGASGKVSGDAVGLHPGELCVHEGLQFRNGPAVRLQILAEAVEVVVREIRIVLAAEAAVGVDCVVQVPVAADPAGGGVADCRSGRLSRSAERYSVRISAS